MKLAAEQLEKLASGVPEIDQTLVIRSSRRTLALEIRPDRTLLVRAPHALGQSRIIEFIQTNSAWIRRTIQRLFCGDLRPKVRFESGEQFLWLGDYYPLEVLDAPAAGEPLDFQNGRFILQKSQHHMAAYYFESWYKTRAQMHFADRVQFYAETFGFERRMVKLSNAKTRWGSCSNKKDLNFSWRLIMAPAPVIDYVIIHELVHCEHFNHSQRFWDRVGQILPDYRDRKRWLREKGHWISLF